MRRTGLILVVVLLAAGCTFANVKPEISVAPPPDPPKVLVTRGVQKWVEEKKAFETVLTERPATLPERSIVLVGTITELDKGSTALRWIVGMGAGQAKVRGDFEIQSATGAVLAKFSTRESYLGGAGIGGAGFLDMDDLIRRFAETVAETAAKWARGEKLDR